MKKIIYIIMVLSLSLNASGCSKDNDDPSAPGDNGNGNTEEPVGETYKVKMTFGNTELTATFEDNATSRAFKEKLPVTLPMFELYSREMCYRFEEALPANEVSNRAYEIGEIIYWTPGRAFVIMYAQNGERFSMQSMGRVDSGVEAFRTTGDVSVHFELIEE
jgi:hypothetical protein